MTRRLVARGIAANGSSRKTMEGSRRIDWRTRLAAEAVDAAHVLAGRGNVDAAVQVLEHHLSEQGLNPWVLATAGHVVQRAGRFQDAIRWYDRALAIQPHSPFTLAMRGDCNSNLGRPRTALADYERALNMGVRDSQRRVELSASAAEIYEFLYSECPSPAYLEKALAYACDATAFPGLRERIEAAGRTAGVSFCLPTHNEIFAARGHLQGASWEPRRDFGGMEFGQVLAGPLLQLFYLKPHPEEAWAPFDEDLNLLVYTDLGAINAIKVNGSLKLKDAEIMGVSVLRLKDLLGGPATRGRQRGNAFVDFPTLGATFFLDRMDCTLEAILSGP